ncbi:MAG: uracil-DNA glycosylase [Bacillota bacterium]|nr:MAG: uracil-DNA glycosylase [Bacillota bacterium]
MKQDAWLELERQIVECTACPRLRQHCLEVARTRRRQFRDWEYWGRPVPGFGDPEAELLIIGLAPAAHGANRTGRMFTGDDSGNWLYEALYRYGWASQPRAVSRDDGLVLRGAYITAAARCAPPQNKPTPEELRACRPFLVRELQLLRRVRLVLVLGRVALDAYLRALRDLGHDPGRPAFGHGAFYPPPAPGLPALLCSYHPSRQNTQTRRLTREMWHEVFARARAYLDEGAGG